MADIIVDTRAALAAAFVQRFERAAAAAIAERGRAALAIPGGSVVLEFAPVLVAASVDWARLDVFWCDERAVPPADPDSNYGLARRAWLSRLPGAGPRVHPMLVDGRPLDQAAREYQDEIIEVLGLPARLDLLLIGMGPDGHVGSLFPAHPAVDERERLVVAVDDAPKPPPQRLTMTLPLMAWARSICLAAFGREKAGAVREVVDDSDSRLPAALVLRGHADAACLLDADAATLLRTT